MNYSDLAARGIVCGEGVVLTGRNIFEPPTRLSRDNIVVGSQLGAYSTVSRGTRIMTANIGRFCSIGEDVIVGPGQHPGNWLTTHAFTYEDNVSDVYLVDGGFSIYRPVEIGHDVWVGSKAGIMGGVRVQHGAIVAFGAVVTKDVPPYAIVASTPARIIKYRFSEKLIERLLAFRWWQFDLPQAVKACLSISWKDPEQALEQLEAARLAYKLPLIGNRAIAINA